MSDRLEFYAATVEDALDKASISLGVNRDQVDYTVLDKGSTGFLGIGIRDARIAVERVERQEASTSGVDELPPEVAAEEDILSAPEIPATTHSAAAGEATDVEVETSYDVIVAVDEFMTALLDTMGLDATVDVYDTEDVIVVDVAVKETGLFIGQKGETIDAIQYLLNVSTYRNRTYVKRIVLDSEGYRQRRVEAIQGMAHRTARRAVREKRPLSLPPMPAAERRVVHLFLQENPNVTTSSDGKEEERRVIVSPV